MVREYQAFFCISIFGNTNQESKKDVIDFTVTDGCLFETHCEDSTHLEIISS